MGLEKRVLNDLEDEGVYDVYFHKGKLIYMNDWDEGAIRRLLKDLYPEFDQSKIVAEQPQESESYFGA